MRYLLLLLSLTTSLHVSIAKPKIKDKSKVTLFTVGSTKYDLKEFEYYFLKNSDKPSADSASYEINDYLKLYIDFRLKVKEAMSLKMNEDKGFIQELDGYKEQLIEPYLLTSKVHEAQVKETYDRMLWEVSGSHILLNNNPNPTPEDTLEVYNRLLDIKKRIEAGEDFGALASEYSDDRSAQVNKGYLGYFTALQMVYPFENAAYNNEVGSIVGPFKTRFGYHLLRVEDKRPARGQVLAAHIMIRHSVGDNTSVANAKKKAESVYENLQSGKNWEEQCSLYSEDRNTADRGGQLKWFSTGNLVPEFENVAFSLEKGEISKPIKTQFGWHIIKLMDKKPVPPFEEQRVSIEKRIQRDSRSQSKKNTALQKIKDQHDFKLDSSALEGAYAAMDSTLLGGEWSVAESASGSKVLFSMEGENYKVSDFWKFVAENQKSRRSTELEAYKEQLYNQYEEETLFTFEKQQIEENNEEFKMLMDEYKSGILLFNLMEDKVWNKAMQDSAGLQQFYDGNKENYVIGEHLDVRKIIVADSALIPSLIENLSWSNDQLDSAYNQNDALAIKVSDRKVMKGEEPILDANWKVGNHVESKEGYTILWVVEELKESGYKELNQTRGLVISDYQSQLEKEWLEELHAKYAVKVSKSALKKYIAEFQ